LKSRDVDAHDADNRSEMDTLCGLIGFARRAANDACVTSGLARICRPEMSFADSVISENHLAFPEEIAYVAESSRERRSEFVTARNTARLALGRIGIPPRPLIPHPDRSPAWPDRITGSISHSGGRCVVAVAAHPSILSIGIDLEVAEPLTLRMEQLVCTRRERALLRIVPALDRAWLGKAIFSIKEAVFKCQYPVTRAALEFQDLCVTVDGDATFSVLFAEGIKNKKLLPERIIGKLSLPPGFIMSLALI
jgi:4'-phosphopantetheinyl transferase EntD